MSLNNTTTIEVEDVIDSPIQQEYDICDFINTLSQSQLHELTILYHKELEEHLPTLSPNEVEFIEDFNTAIYNSCDLVLTFPGLIEGKEYTFDWLINAFKYCADGRWAATKGCAKVKNMILESGRLNEFKAKFKTMCDGFKADINKHKHCGKFPHDDFLSFNKHLNAYINNTCYGEFTCSADPSIPTIDELLEEYL